MIKYLLTVSALLLLAPLAQASPTASCTARCAYRTGTTCTAPAFVHVDCIGDGRSETRDSDASVRPFHDLQYKIDYGDSACRSGQGTWPNSDMGASKNVDYSPIGAHVYECAGTFAITTTVTDSRGATSSAVETVTVEAEDAGWNGANTRCVANGTTPVAGVGGCPAGTTSLVNSSDFDASILTGPGKRTLFKCGDTFAINANPALSDASTNGSLVGGYSATTCIGNPVLVTYNGSADILTTPNVNQFLSGWRLRDLRFTVTGAGSNTKVITTGRQTPNFLELRVEKLNVGSCWTFSREPTAAGFNELSASVSTRCNITVHSVSSADCSTAVSDWPVQYGVGTRYGAFIDNYWSVAPSVHDACGTFRISGANHTLWAHNKYKSEGVSGASVQFRSASGSANRPAAWNVVTDWLTLDAGQEGFTYFRVCPEHGCNAGPDTDPLTSDFIFDGIRIVTGANKTTLPIFPFMIYSPNVTIRNSILNARAGTGSGGSSFLQLSQIDATQPPPRNVDFYNNTMVRGSASSNAVSACNTRNNFSGAELGSGHHCRNNLIFEVSSTNNAGPSGYACPGCAQSHNLHLRSSVEGCPFFGQTGTCNFSAAGITQPFSEFRLRTDGLGGVNAVKDAGFTFPDSSSGSKGYVFRDAFGGCRGGLTGGPSGLFDIGAGEVGSESCVGTAVSGALSPPTLLAP